MDVDQEPSLEQTERLNLASMREVLWRRLGAHSIVTTIAIIAVGATLGAVLRYYVSLWSATYLGAGFPYGTFIINITGSLILGCFLTLAAERAHIGTEWRLLIATGFCGSFTTFSTFSYESLTLLNNGSYIGAGLYMIGSVALGLVGVVLGVILARLLFL